MAVSPERRRQIDAMNQQEKYRRRVAAGLCTKCGRPANRVRCPACLNKLNAYRRRKRKEQKEVSRTLPPGVTNGDIEEQQKEPNIVLDAGQRAAVGNVEVVHQGDLVHVRIRHHDTEFDILRDGKDELEFMGMGDGSQTIVVPGTPKAIDTHSWKRGFEAGRIMEREKQEQAGAIHTPPGVTAGYDWESGNGPHVRVPGGVDWVQGYYCGFLDGKEGKWLLLNIDESGCEERWPDIKTSENDEE